MSSKKLSACIITFNEQDNIRDCLESVTWADEIIVVDSFSRDNTVAICKEFAAQAGWTWQGAVMLGGGGMPSKQARIVLDEAGDALASGGSISAEIAERASKPTMPLWLYILGGNAMWRRVAKKRGISPKDLRAKPYA